MQFIRTTTQLNLKYSNLSWAQILINSFAPHKPILSSFTFNPVTPLVTTNLTYANYRLAKEGVRGVMGERVSEKYGKHRVCVFTWVERVMWRESVFGHRGRNWERVRAISWGQPRRVGFHGGWPLLAAAMCNLMVGLHLCGIEDGTTRTRSSHCDVNVFRWHGRCNMRRFLLWFPVV